MESYEKRSDQAESQADRLEEEGDRVERSIDEARSDWQSKKGSLPGMQEEGGDAVQPDAAEEGEEPNTTSVD